MNRQINFRIAAIVIAAFGLLLTLIIIGVSFAPVAQAPGSGQAVSPGSGSQSVSGLSTLQRFTSEDDFKKYLEKSHSLNAVSAFSFLGGLRQGFSEGAVPPMASPLAADNKATATGIGGGPERFSETNVQVAGIDEPDIAKTDGQEIYFSPNSNFFGYRPMPLIAPSGGSGAGIASPIVPPNGEIQNISAFPLENLKVDGQIKKSGSLLLNDKILVVLPENNFYPSQENKIFGYDVTDPAKPQEKWNMEIKDNSQLVAARLYQNKIYIVVRSGINENHPCLLEPLALNGKAVSVSCLEIYHPVQPITTDSTYSIFVLDPKSGAVQDTTSFLGSTGDSTVYMSPESIFVTYYYPGDFVAFVADFFKENKDLVPDWLTQKIEKLKGYDLSAEAKQVELQTALSRFQNSLSADERKRIENEFRNRMEDFFKLHKRNLERTGIVKISVNTLDIAASGSVPGKPLNQFSLDEYQNNLRVATTVGSGWWGFGFGGTRDSANDVYILNGNLQVAGAIQDLGLDEQIFSARFVEDRGYLVTFRQTDPFFVLDLSDPARPEVKGQLKIPGFSSYLHPIAKNKILGVGQENGGVKLSLFDVSDAANPREISHYNLAENYSEISQTHHAFLEDEKHNAFFLPGGQSGYIFSFENNNLRLVKAVADITARRAVYIDDFLYVLGDDKLVVLDEKNWEKVKELSF